MKTKSIISVIACAAVMLAVCPLDNPVSSSLDIFSVQNVMTVEAASIGRTKEQAVSWIQNAADTKFNRDVDGAYGTQCVDLIMGYYEYFGVRSYAKGNGKDYATNTLPSGWTRINNPKLTDIKAGDVVVWKAGVALTKTGGKADSTYGHVGLCLKDGTSSGFTTVETRGGSSIYANVYQRSAVSCVIRPKYDSSVYKNVLVNNATYRIYSACSGGKTLCIGTAENKFTSKNNVQLVDKNSSSSLWIAKYNETLDYWYFIPKSNQKLALNPFADNIVSKVNVNLYAVSNDATQGFYPVRNDDGSYKLLNASNPKVALEVSGYATKASAGSNIRVYSNISGEKTQNFYFERV